MALPRECLALVILAACGARTDLPLGAVGAAPSFDAADAAHAAAATDAADSVDAVDARDASRAPPEIADAGRDATFPPSPDASAGLDVPVVPCAGGCVLTFASGSDWASYAGTTAPDGTLASALGPSLGPARAVCVTPNNPPNCPVGALNYDSPATPWGGGRGIPSAFWIWRADVTTAQAGDFQVAAFQKSFVVGAQPTGSIQIAVDDLAEVFVSGRLVSTVGSVTNYAAAGQAQNVLVTLDLTPALAPGAVTVTVVAQNGPSSFGTGCSAAGCTYGQNPAGVVFAGMIRWQ